MLWGSIRSTVKKISETKSEILRKLRGTPETFGKPEIGTLTLGLLFSFLMSNSQLQTSLMEGLCPSNLLGIRLKVWRSFFERNNNLTSLATTTTLKLPADPLGELWGAQTGRQKCCSHRNPFPWLPWVAPSLPGPGSSWMGDSDTMEEMEKAQCRQ